MSIRKRIATIATTLVLLSGLFGAAIVPVTMAAATDPATVTGVLYSTSATPAKSNGTFRKPFGFGAAQMLHGGIAINLTVKDASGAFVNAKPLSFSANAGFYVSAVSGACTAVGTPTTNTSTVVTSSTGLACLSVKAVSASRGVWMGAITVSSVTGIITRFYVSRLGRSATSFELDVCNRWSTLPSTKETGIDWSGASDQGRESSACRSSLRR